MNYNNSKPIYQQIGDIMSEKILTGTWKPGERIPSVRELALSLEVNPNTVLKSFSFLEENEVIYKKRGIGYFVHAEGNKKIMAVKKAEFIKNRLPDFIKQMRLLEITLEEFKQFYLKQE